MANATCTSRTGVVPYRRQSRLQTLTNKAVAKRPPIAPVGSGMPMTR